MKYLRYFLLTLLLSTSCTNLITNQNTSVINQQKSIKNNNNVFIARIKQSGITKENKGQLKLKLNLNSFYLKASNKGEKRYLVDQIKSLNVFLTKNPEKPTEEIAGGEENIFEIDIEELIAIKESIEDIKEDIIDQISNPTPEPSISPTPEPSPSSEPTPSPTPDTTVPDSCEDSFFSTEIQSCLIDPLSSTNCINVLENLNFGLSTEDQIELSICSENEEITSLCQDIIDDYQSSTDCGFSTTALDDLQDNLEKKKAELLEKALDEANFEDDLDILFDDVPEGEWYAVISAFDSEIDSEVRNNITFNNYSVSQNFGVVDSDGYTEYSDESDSYIVTLKLKNEELPKVRTKINIIDGIEPSPEL